MYKPMNSKVEKRFRESVETRLVENKIKARMFPNRINYTPHVFEVDSVNDNAPWIPVINTVSSISANYTIYRDVELVPEVRNEDERYLAMFFKLFLEAVIKKAYEQNRIQIFIMTSNPMLLEQLLDFNFQVIVAGKIDLSRYKANLFLER